MMFHWEINLNTCLAIFFGNHQSLKDDFYEGLSNIFTKNIVTEFNFSSIIIYSVNWFLTGFYWILLKTLHKFSIIAWQLNLSTCQFTFLEVTEQCLLFTELYIPSVLLQILDSTISSISTVTITITDTCTCTCTCT